MKTPDFEINTGNGPVPDNMIVDLPGFYAHMMDFVVAAIYDGPSTDILCRFIDENDNIFTSTLDYEGYKQSLSRCLEYFESVEEFERCTIIKKILNERL
jgi:hypothetical protein